MKSYLIPKRYNYFYKYLETNKGIQFLKNQVEKLSTFNIDLLEKYASYIDTSSDKKVESQVIVNDIKQFIFEINKADSYLKKDYYKLSKGFDGEEKVKNILYTYNDAWKVFSNATLNVNGNTIENDFIVITKGGVSVIEVKNIGSYLDKLKIDKLGRVIRLNRHSKVIDSIDIVTQNNRHLAYLNQYLKSIGYSNVPIYSYIVITSNIQIENKSDFKFIGPNQIYKEITIQEDKIKLKEIDYIYNRIIMDLKEDNKYPYIDYISVLEENYNLILRSIKEYIDSA